MGNFTRLVFVTLSTAVFAMLATFLILYIQIKQPLPATYQGIDERGIAFPVGFYIISSLTLLSMPIYLNLVKLIRNDLAYSFLSFFLLPTVAIFFVFNSSHYSLRMMPFLFVFIGPFLLALSINFYFYRLYIKACYRSINP